MEWPRSRILWGNGRSVGTPTEIVNRARHLVQARPNFVPVSLGEVLDKKRFHSGCGRAHPSFHEAVPEAVREAV